MTEQNHDHGTGYEAALCYIETGHEHPAALAEPCLDCGDPIGDHTAPGDTDGMSSCVTCLHALVVCDIRLRWDPVDEPAPRYRITAVDPELLAAIAAEKVDELPAGATVEPWSTADDEELTEELSLARFAIAARWSHALRGGAEERALVVQSNDITDEELTLTATRYGLAPTITGDVPARDYAARLHELVQVWTAYVDWTRGLVAGDPLYNRHAALVASHDGFEERTAIRTGDATRWPIYASGVAWMAARDDLRRDETGRSSAELTAYETMALRARG